MRGEHDTKKTPFETEEGSSPHARGAQRQARLDDLRQGIIPACAGSTVIYLQAYQMF